MDCAECKSWMIEAAEGDLAEERAASFRSHLASCESCRTAFDLVERGAGILRETIPLLAPRETYLTRARMDQILAARSGETKIFRLFSYRQFVSAAAAAAILISAAFIAGGLASMRSAPPDETPIARVAPAEYLPIVLAATGREDPGHALGHMAVVKGARTSWAWRPQGERPVSMDSPGVVVPVQHAFYDPAESPYWW
ncbi:MAG: zf-HC2 domain-containing protein [Candidatus Brocadiaceae bacterium]|nr:zf-HC2 domain-containing protein [Candidatus Brocadiaceae bacterium]